MHTLANWTARRSGPALTVTGTDEVGQTVKHSLLDAITVEDGEVIATEGAFRAQSAGRGEPLKVRLLVEAPSDDLAKGAVLSDLFFNSDLESAKIMERGEFQGWNEDELLELAQAFRHRLKVAGVRDVPGAEMIVRDFRDRV